MMNDESSSSPFSSSPMHGDASLVVVVLVVLDALVVFVRLCRIAEAALSVKTPDEHVSSEGMVRTMAWAAAEGVVLSNLIASAS
jgi:hypothetical protein